MPGRTAREGAGQKGFDADHMTLPALRTIKQRLAGEQQIAVTVVERRIGTRHHGHGSRDQRPTKGQLRRAMAVGQKAVMANPL